MASLGEPIEEKGPTLGPPVEEPKGGPTLGPPVEDAVHHSAMVERMLHGDQMMRIVKAVGSGAKEGFGSPDYGAQLFRSMVGPGELPSERPVKGSMDALSVAGEYLLKVGAGAADLTQRGLTAGLYGIGAGTKQQLEDWGMAQGDANRAGNELMNLIGYQMTKAANHPAPIQRMRVTRDAEGTVRMEPVGSVPVKADFDKAAENIHSMVPERATMEAELARLNQLAVDHLPQALRQGGEAARTQAGLAAATSELERALKGPFTKADPVDVGDKLRALHEQYGYHPNEILADAANDPVLARDLASDNPLLPERYTGINPEKMKADQLATDAAAREQKAAPAIDGISPEFNQALKERVSWPKTPEVKSFVTDLHEPTPSMQFGIHVGMLFDRMGWNIPEMIHNLQMQTTPMANRLTGFNQRAAAKDFANTIRVARYDGHMIDYHLTNEFTPEARKRMFEAIDKEDAAKMAGKPLSSDGKTPPPAAGMVRVYHGGEPNGEPGPRWFTTDRKYAQGYADKNPGNKVSYLDLPEDHPMLRPEYPEQGVKQGFTFAKELPEAEAAKRRVIDQEATGGMASLDPRERAVANALRRRMAETYKEAGDLKMHGDKNPREFYVPRMLESTREATAPGVTSLDQLGRNLRTSTSNLRRRKYDTSEQTEAAAKAVLGDDAFLVRDIRTLNLANSRLQEAVAGKRLINAVKDLSKDAGENTVVTSVPEGKAKDYFTIDHPSFRQVKPDVQRGPDGKWVRMENADGTPRWANEQLHVSRDFEGPLRAVLSQPEGALYRGMIALKAKAMAVIMVSPLLHNAVIYGRALPAVNGNPLAAFRLYWDGNKVKWDAPTMREAIQNGFVPIGKNGLSLDLKSITGADALEPGQSITAQLAAAIPGLWSREAGTAVKQRIDQFGNFWHNKMLWERVGDLQAGLYKRYLDDLVGRGFERDTASRMASHLANRYAGVLPQEAMSQNARKLANVALFSRSYTLGNIGSMKDMFTGLPRDVLAQIERDRGLSEVAKIRSYGQKKAFAIVTMDMALFYAGNAVLQSTIQTLKSDKDWPEALKDEYQGYVDRFQKAMKHIPENPFSIIGLPQALSPTSENEPGKEGRVFTGLNSDGTGVYVKNPVGKTGEDMLGWLTQFSTTGYNKLNPVGVRPTMDVLHNQDYAGHHVYNPYAELPKEHIANAAKIAWYMMKSAVVPDYMLATVDLVKGEMKGNITPDEVKMDALQMIGPMAGLMFSKGFPGGPAQGFLAQAKKMEKEGVANVMQDVRTHIRRGEMDEARELMTGAKMDARYQQYVVETTLNPGNVRKAMTKFMTTLTPEEREKVDKAREKFGQ